MERIISRITPTVPILPKCKRVAAYARVSSVKDAMHLSLANQVSYYSAYIQKHPEWQYAGVYADDGYTGTRDDRPEFQRLLTECFGGNVDLIITKSISRFSRNTLTTLELLRRLKEINVDVFFEKENVHSISGDGELLLTILSSFAQAESLSVSENCKWRIRKKMEQGEIVGLRDMYGYVIERGQITIEPTQAVVVRRIFSDYVDGLSTMQIAKALNAEGIVSYTGVSWTDKRIRDLLRNEKYTGNALLQKKFTADHLTKREKINHGELPKFYAEGTHVAIVDQGTFDRAQEILARRRDENRPSKPTTTRYPFSGLITCGNCGDKFRRRTCHGKVYWQCATFLYQGKDSCLAKQIPEETLYRTTVQALCIPVFDPAAFSEQIERIIVTGSNSLRYEFKDGHFTEFGWQDRSRRESWTPEMKQAAREKQKAIWEKRNGNSTQGHKD